MSVAEGSWVTRIASGDPRIQLSQIAGDRADAAVREVVAEAPRESYWTSRPRPHSQAFRLDGPEPLRQLEAAFQVERAAHHQVNQYIHLVNPGFRLPWRQWSSKPNWSNFRVRAFSETMRVLSSGNPSLLDAVISTVISRSTPSGAARCWMTSWYSRLMSRP